VTTKIKSAVWGKNKKKKRRGEGLNDTPTSNLTFSSRHWLRFNRILPVPTFQNQSPLSANLSITVSTFTRVADLNPHHFGKLDPDPHKSEKPDPDPD
jgi:hypothetical protein